MDNQKIGLLRMIRSAMTDSSEQLPKDFDLSQAADLALQHRIIAMVYYGALRCGVSKNREEMQKLLPLLVRTIIVAEQQNAYTQALFEALEANGIDYLPLKGAVLREMYTPMEMRIMGDVDILIRMEQYPQIQQIMEEQSYTLERDKDHEIAWRRGNVEIEFHRSMVPTSNGDFYAYFGTGWKRAHKLHPDSFRYAHSDEDFYIFLVTHFAKHYRMAGIGIKHMVDLWAFRRSRPHMDYAYIDAELKKLYLRKFHDNIVDTLAVWFDDGPENDVTQYITSVIFESGEYGISENFEASRILRDAVENGSVKKTKRRDFWSKVFPSRKKMKAEYPVLNRLPFLLPVFWVVRWFALLFRRQSVVRSYFDKNGRFGKNRIELQRQALQFVGLEFHGAEGQKGETT